MQLSIAWATRHLILSLLVISLPALLVFCFWYPSPFWQMLGVVDIFVLTIVMVIAGGPLLTLLLVNPKKTYKAVVWDIAMITLIQVIALGYGIWTVYSARPVAVVFEVDRLFVVAAHEVLNEQLDQVPIEVPSLPWKGVRYLTVRSAQTADELFQSVQLSLNGVTTAMRSSWWRPYAEGAPGMRQSAKPLMNLIHRHPEQREQLEDAAAKAGIDVNDLRFLPLTSSRTMEWIVLLGEGEKIVGYAQIDGFE